MSTSGGWPCWLEARVEETCAKYHITTLFNGHQA